MIEQKFKDCIEACNVCVVTCTQCAMACLEEEHVQHLRNCIRLNMECVAYCRLAVELMSMDSSRSKEFCAICAAICEACALECEAHAARGMDHCRICAEVCRQCADACREMAA